MFLRTKQTPLFVMSAICVALNSGLARQPQRVPSAVPHDASTRACFFAEERARFTFLAKTHQRGGEEPALWKVEWSLASSSRTLQRGSATAAFDADAELLRYVVEVPMPALRKGLAMPLQLKMRWSCADQTRLLDKQLFLFSRDAFSHRQSLLEDANIKVFDPLGKTIELLEKHEIPHTRLLNLTAIDLATEGILLVGEGVSLNDQRNLLASLLGATSRGVSVICLAPSDGDIPLSIEFDGQLLRPRQLALAREDVVRRFDKSFDRLSTASHLSLQARKGGVRLSTGGKQADWSWLEMEFAPQFPAATHSKMIVCGLSVVDQWEESPVPRYLFLRLLEELTSTQPTLEKKNALFE